jgi:hypothetical protein
MNGGAWPIMTMTSNKQGAQAQAQAARQKQKTPARASFFWVLVLIKGAVQRVWVWEKMAGVTCDARPLFAVWGLVLGLVPVQRTASS